MYKYINLENVIEAVQERANLGNKKRIREKMIDILDMLDIDRSLLKQVDNRDKQEGEYMFPIESKEFLVKLIISFTDTNIKEMRRGNFHNVDVEEMKKMIDGFEMMFHQMKLPNEQVKDQIIRMYDRTKLPFWEAKKNTQDILREMIENLEMNSEQDELCLGSNPTGKEIRETLKKHRTRRFRYFEPYDKVNVNDQLIFLDMMCKDYQNLHRRHKAIYQIFKEIREEELFEEVAESVANMTSEEEAELMYNMNTTIIVQNELRKNPYYNEITSKKTEILKSNKFVKDKEPEYKKICDEIKKLNEDVQVKLFGKIVLKEDREVGAHKENDFTNRKSSKDGLNEAIKEFEESQQFNKEYQEKMNKVTPEQWNQLENMFNNLKTDIKIRNLNERGI